MNTLEQAFTKIHREDFVPQYIRDQAGVDAALPIGYGQTISQPTTVRLMMEWLNVGQGNKVLDVGSGSGWTTALLSYVVGLRGKVFAVERIPELVEFGRENCRKVGVLSAKFFKAGKHYGLPRHSPYDRILVSAAAEKLPEELLEQLKIGGKLVIPVRNDILEITKITNDTYDTSVHPGFIFVPLI